VLLLILSLIIAGSMIPSRFTVNPTPSLGTKLFFLKRSPDTVSKGDYVVFKMKETDRHAPGKQLVKQVTCDEGDRLTIKENEYWCNGKDSLGKAKDMGLKGERLDPFVYNGIIPKGVCFVSGHHKDSYDSRYWGFLSKKEVNALAYPLF
jgi:signal peptidase I/conjugal transfer pilin signal peptidase TrbI